ncbi:MAG: hypothetical protein WDO15_16815 [Bacteroidota bacterium]
MTYRSPLLFVAALLLIVNCFAQQSPKPGVVDASGFDFSKGRLNLGGSWIWYDNKLLTPSELGDAEGLPVEFPSTWNDKRASESGQGFATYRLTVVVPHGSQQLAIDMPQIYSSYVLFINGEELARNGTPGKTFETTVPQWRPQIVPLPSKSDTLKIVLQIANFNHHKGGVKEAITLGTESMFMQKEFSFDSRQERCDSVVVDTRYRFRCDIFKKREKDRRDLFFFAVYHMGGPFDLQ